MNNPDNRADPASTPGAGEQVVLDTKWFRVVSRRSAETPEPYYVIHSSDFVVVLALTTAGDLVLVRQYRQGVQQFTLELPAGNVEEGETPEETARKELMEETGYEADHFELLAQLSLSPARFSNKIWCYLAKGARRNPEATLEPGNEPVLFHGDLRNLLQETEFITAAQYGVIAVALLSGKLKLPAVIND